MSLVVRANTHVLGVRAGGTATFDDTSLVRAHIANGKLTLLRDTAAPAPAIGDGKRPAQPAARRRR